MQYVVAVLVGLALSQLATLITTVYLHRVLSHRSIRLHPALTMFMRFGTWMLTSISPREWVAVHRKHHNFSDVEGDPHSPWRYGTGPRALLKGMFHAHVGWLFDRRQTNAARYAPDGLLGAPLCEGDAEVRLLLAHPPLQLLDVLGLYRVRGVVREGAVELEVHRDVLERELLEERGEHLARHPVAGVHHHLELARAELQVDRKSVV